MTTPQPPAWAQRLVALFVPARGGEGILGDLLEEYHEAQLPARGAQGADRWYVRQAFGFVWQWCLPWGLFVSAVMIARDAYDLALPTSHFSTRAAVTTYTSLSVFTMGGFVSAWRSRRALSGTVLGGVAALISCVIVSLYAVTAGAVLLAAASARHPQLYAALVDTDDVPIVPILILGVLAGSIGGAAGKALSRGTTRVDLA